MSKRKDRDEVTPNDEAQQDEVSEKVPQDGEEAIVQNGDNEGDNEWDDSKSDDNVSADDSSELAEDNPVSSDKESQESQESSKEEEIVDQPEPSDSESKVISISKGKASLIISGADEARNEANEPQALVPEPRVAVAKIEEAEPEEEQVEDSIQRLENMTNPGKDRIKVDKAKFEKLEIRPDEAEIQEQQWGSGLTQGWWVAIAGASAAVLLLGGLSIESWYSGDEAHTVAEPPAFVHPESDPHEGSPEKWFHQRAGQIGLEASAVLKAFVAAKDDVSRSQYVRFPERYIEQMAQKKVVIKPRLNDLDGKSLDIKHTDDTAFLIVDCQDADFMPFRAYFTREGEHLKLDWEATVARCETDLHTIKKSVNERRVIVDALNKKVRLANDEYTRAVSAREKALEENRQQKIGKGMEATPKVHVVPAVPAPVSKPDYPPEVCTEPSLVRCKVRRRDEFYAGPYNDKDHSAFMLISADSAYYMWAYTPRDSALDLELRRLLDHGRFVVDLKKDLRVTVRVRRSQKDALPSQLELMELIHPEWVTP
ncbi:MAG: hypothetical protein QNL01_00405 [Akkermansiaceae bacterium]|jgi:hypothetical protein|tara:strand:- start:7804 stop:9423 length:1620 start_codon:yes stop_codon:yes gene_type:complete